MTGLRSRDVLACDHCHTAIKLVGDDLAIHNLLVMHTRWENGYPCPTDGCRHQLTKVTDSGVLESLTTLADTGLIRLHYLNAMELFQAMCGCGLPEEAGRRFSQEVIASLFTSTISVTPALRTTPSGRVIVESLTLSNGLTIHLCPSSQGAAVLKVTKPHDHARD